MARFEEMEERGLDGWRGYVPTTPQYNALRLFHEQGPGSLSGVRNSTLRALERYGILNTDGSGFYSLTPEGLRMFQYMGWVEASPSTLSGTRARFDAALSNLGLGDMSIPVDLPLKALNFDLGEQVLYREVATGGERGSSDEGRPPTIPYSTGKSLGDFEELEMLMELLCPTMPYFQYRRMCRELVVQGTYDTRPDWYGGYTTYAYYLISVDALYTWLVDNEALTEGSDD